MFFLFVGCEGGRSVPLGALQGEEGEAQELNGQGQKSKHSSESRQGCGVFRMYSIVHRSLFVGSLFLGCKP